MGVGVARKVEYQAAPRWDEADTASELVRGLSGRQAGCHWEDNPPGAQWSGSGRPEGLKTLGWAAKVPESVWRRAW